MEREEGGIRPCLQAWQGTLVSLSAAPTSGSSAGWRNTQILFLAQGCLMCYCQDFSSSCKGHSRFQHKGPISHSHEASSLNGGRESFSRWTNQSHQTQDLTRLFPWSPMSLCVYTCVSLCTLESFLLLHGYSHGGRRRVPE